MCSTYEPNRFSMTPLRFATPRVSHVKHLHFPLSSLDGLGFGLVLLCFLSQPGMTMELRRDKLVFLCSSENSTQLLCLLERPFTRLDLLPSIPSSSNMWSTKCCIWVNAFLCHPLIRSYLSFIFLA